METNCVAEIHELHGFLVDWLSTAFFNRDHAAPNDVAWLHLHETWIDGHTP